MEELKEFIQHLRSIHFAMVITAGTILLGISGGGSIYEKAIVQLRDVNQLHEQLTDNSIADAVDKELGYIKSDTSSEQKQVLEHFILQSLEEYFENLGLDTEIDRFNFSADDYIKQPIFEYDFPPNFIWFTRHNALLSDGKALYPSAFGWGYAGGNALKDKQQYLDSLIKVDTLLSNPKFDVGYHFHGSTMETINRSADNALVEQLQDVHDISVFASLHAVHLTDNDSRLAYQQSQEVLEEDPIGYENYRGDFDTFELSLSIKFNQEGTTDKQSLAITLQLPFMFEISNVEFMKAMLKRLKSGGEAYPRYLDGARNTEELFPELIQVTRLVSSANYSDLEKYLLQQVKENNAPINVFGLTIDSKLIGIWGVVLLLFIQLYFGMHYLSFVSQLTPGERLVYPWIAMYRDNISMIMFQLSLSLPIVVCLFMLLDNGIGLYGFRLMFLAIASALFIWIVKTYNRHRLFDKGVEREIITIS